MGGGLTKFSLSVNLSLLSVAKSALAIAIFCTEAFGASCKILSEGSSDTYMHKV